jgi:hypothetical protein
MRLSMEEVQEMKAKCNPKYDTDYINLIDTIETQQQEIEHIQAQAAAMREALNEAISIITRGRLTSIGSFHNTYDSQISTFFIDKWTAALDNAGKDYHNPADVEALRQAKEALELIYNKHTDITNHHKYPRTCVICREALTAIEKALGGNGDGI